MNSTTHMEWMDDQVTSCVVEYDCGYVWWAPPALLEGKVVNRDNEVSIAEELKRIADMNHDSICKECR